MKKFLSLTLVLMAIALPMTAQESDGQSKPKPVILSTLPLDDDPNPIIHRAPMRICVEAWYDAPASTLSIIYYGEAEGEVSLYRDGELIDSSSVINTTFPVSESGLYSIEIITDSWTASGSLEI